MQDMLWEHYLDVKCKLESEKELKSYYINLKWHIPERGK